jgi:hypothetical protein
MDPPRYHPPSPRRDASRTCWTSRFQGHCEPPAIVETDSAESEGCLWPPEREATAIVRPGPQRFVPGASR